mmetsp:Transcript_25346/g.37900  ORF Transcript_25346/g.37900 Transcript_25346/m.37900 type:complete len:151 (-) Transcript_25346:522-974(-)
MEVQIPKTHQPYDYSLLVSRHISMDSTLSVTPARTSTLPKRTVTKKNDSFLYITGHATEQEGSKDMISTCFSFNSSNRDIVVAIEFKADCIMPFNSDSYFTISTNTYAYINCTRFMTASNSIQPYKGTSPLSTAQHILGIHSRTEQEMDG